MTTDLININGMLDDLSLSLVTVDPEDLISLGEILGKVEQLAEEAGDQEPTRTLLTGMRRTLEAVILESAADKNLAMDLVSQGAAALQEAQRELKAGRSPEVDLAGYLDAMAANGVSVDDLRPAEKAPESEPPEPPAPPSEPEPALEAEQPTEAAAKPPADEPAGQYDTAEDQELFFSFVNESLEHIETIEVNIISLEQDPEDKEIINSVFRPFHTIKGVSGFLNLRRIHRLAHDVESLLDDARNDRAPVSADMIDVVLDAVDVLKRMITNVKTSLETGAVDEEEYGLEDLLQRIHAVQQGAGAAPGPPTRPAAPSYAGRKLGEILLDQDVIGEEELEQVLHNQEVDRLRRLGDIIVEKGVITPEELEAALQRQMAAEEKKLGEILRESGLADERDIDEALSEQERLRQQRLGERLIKEKQAGAREVAGALREQRTETAPVSRTVKVDTEKLDSLVDMVGELVIAQSLVHSNENVLELKDQKLFRDLSHMSRITSDLQRVAMSMRMVPIRQTFQKMIRLVRDLSRKSGKQVELTMSGEETEIDRNMVEAIYDPLVHMIRNSVDHGVETPKVREERGKPAEGSILLKAYHQGGNVVIQIVDDGQGLNREKILKKAVERGLASPEDNLSDSAVFNLIFQPGFSTADQVTDVSGRGVGMDVVKRAIEKLRGKVEIESEPGKGSSITIRLPLTLAIIDGMIVRVGDNRYILPTISIHESFRPDRGDYHTVKGQGEMIKVRKNLLPLVRLDRILGAEGAAVDPAEALVIVVENDGERRCIMVDEVLGKQEVVIKSLGERLKYVRALAGGSILGDGRVGLILDVAGMFEVSDDMMGGAPPQAAAPAGDWEMNDDWGMGPT